MKKLTRLIAALLLVVSIFTAMTSCDVNIKDMIDSIIGTNGDIQGGGGTNVEDDTHVTELTIKNGDKLTLSVGDVIQLYTNLTDSQAANIEWSASNSCVTVSGGTVMAVSEGACIVYARYGKLSDHVLIQVVAEGADTGNGDGAGDGTGDDNSGNVGDTNTDIDPDVDPYVDVDKDTFYANYTPSVGYWDSYYRSLHGLMSGNIGDQDQAPTISAYQPMYDGMYVRNNVGIYGSDGNSYTIVDAYGNPVMTIYRGGAYIMLEEVAAYLFAFGEIPANHTAKKKTSQATDMFATWGEYLRLNFSKFSGSTKSYPYEPELPNINGCGGDLQYYEVDVGTTGTDCDPSYPVVVYNDGRRIERGAARIVFSVYDKNGDAIIDINEKYLFYTYNHYNDFQEYLNYWGGWGEMFGNITGGGTLSSKTNYNPTPYVRSIQMDIRRVSAVVFFEGYFIVIDNKVYA